jgi:non-heme chloroperoxidase
VPKARVDDGIAISYQTIGAGPRDVLFMHGWGGAGSGHSWKELLKYLDLTGLRVIVADLRGHGHSDKPPSGFNTEQFAKDMFAVADHAKADKLVVIGFSMSGKWAQWMACTQPDRVIGQVLIAPAPATGLPLTEEILEQWLKASQNRSLWEQFIQGFAKDLLCPDVVDGYFKDVSTTPRLALTETYNMCKTGTFVDRLKATHAATLVIAGAHDPMFTPQFLRQEVTAHIPGARLVVLDCGHETPLELPQQTSGLLEAFLAGLKN